MPNPKILDMGLGLQDRCTSLHSLQDYDNIAAYPMSRRQGSGVGGSWARHELPGPRMTPMSLGASSDDGDCEVKAETEIMRAQDTGMAGQRPNSWPAGSTS